MTLSRLLHNPAYVMADEQVRLHYMGLGVNVTSPTDAFDGVHGVLLVGKRNASDRKYSKSQNHSASVLNSVGIVPSELWLRCQNKLAHNRQVGNSGKGKHTWLSGLLKCAKCSYSLKVVSDKSYRALVCSGRYNLSRCDTAIHIKLMELEQIVEAGIGKFLDECPAEHPEPQEDGTFARRCRKLWSSASCRLRKRRRSPPNSFAASTYRRTRWRSSGTYKPDHQGGRLMKACMLKLYASASGS